MDELVEEVGESDEDNLSDGEELSDMDEINVGEIDDAFFVCVGLLLLTPAAAAANMMTISLFVGMRVAWRL